MKIKWIVILYYCILSSLNSYGQSRAADSLLNVYHAHTIIDSIKYTALLNVFRYYRTKEPVKALAFSDSLLWLARQIKQPVIVADAYAKKGNLLTIQGFTNEAVKIYTEGINSLNNNNSREALQAKSGMYLSLGTTLRVAGRYDVSLQAVQTGIEIAYRIKDTTLILNANNNIGTIYMAIADWQTALAYMQANKALLELNGSRLLKKESFLREVYAGALLNIGNIQSVLKEYDKSLISLDTALALSRRWKLINLETATAGILADVYFKLNDYYNSYLFQDFSYQYHLKLHHKQYLSIDYRGLGRIFRDAPDSFLINRNIPAGKRYDTALTLLTKSITMAEELTSLSLAEDPAEELSILYEKMNNYPKAYEYYQKFKTIHDSLGRASQQKSILVNDMQYRFGRQTDSLKFTQALQQSKLQQLLSANEQAALLTNKEKELQHLAFLKTQADLQNAGFENGRNEKELLLIKKEKELQAAQVNKLAKDKELAKYKLKQQKITGLVAIAFLSLITFFIIYNSRLRRKRMAAVFEKDTANQQLKEAELKNKMNDITLSALRSQMNPHFIFNCLNSIMLYTVENKTDEAAAYISRFSKLIRNMLDSSRSDRVTLASELESIKLYIELEAMRFKNKLQYSITIDKNIDSDFTEIPPLLVQPYIENAIWHGLMTKPAGGLITIAVAEDATAELLLLTISDNGIGRKAAEAIKSKKETYHKSLGTKVTGERIALINEKFKSRADVTITDLYDTNHEPSGTQVIIKLPLE